LEDSFPKRIYLYSIRLQEPKWNYDKLSEVAIVKEVDNITKPFAVDPNKGKHHYGEKVHLCDVDSEAVIFLDADTFVRKDITTLLEGSFDFSAMPVFSDVIGLQNEARLFSKISKKSVPQYKLRARDIQKPSS